VAKRKCQRKNPGVPLPSSGRRRHLRAGLLTTCDMQLAATNLASNRSWLFSWLALPSLLLFCSCAGLGNDTRDLGETSSLAAQQQGLQTIQPGDTQLTCEDLMTQMEQMDGIASYSVTGGESKSYTVTKAVAGTAASQAMGFIPVVGPVLAGVAGALSGTVGSSNSAQQMQQQNTMALAQQRKQHLLKLYDEKKCSMPSTPTEPRQARGR
jgi:hypothetical protein